MLCVRVWLFSAPITDGFGMVTLLAGLAPETRSVLHGAAFTGKLTHPVRVQITVRREKGEVREGLEQVEYVLEGRGPNAELRSGIIYE